MSQTLMTRTGLKTTIFLVSFLAGTLSVGSLFAQTETKPTKQKTPSGLEYIILEEGTGPKPKQGQKVQVHYTGKLQDGTVFDSSHKRGKPIAFTLGIGQVIKGWDEGIALLKKGGKAQLIIPPSLGYGARGVPPQIPPNATLIFDVELVEIE